MITSAKINHSVGKEIQYSLSDIKKMRGVFEVVGTSNCRIIVLDKNTILYVNLPDDSNSRYVEAFLQSDWQKDKFILSNDKIELSFEND